MDQKTQCGVIVGRFQVDKLSEGHRNLIEHVREKHKTVIIFLGLSHCKVTRNNPLDFMSRKQMIQAEYPDINILYIKDVKRDEEWSKDLDRQLADLVPPGMDPILYGSRESFIAHYTGKHQTKELKQEVFTSGTAIRHEISAATKASPDFRKGVIWAAYNQWTKIYPTVDVAIWDEDEEHLLMARKPGEKKYRFIGGFVDSKAPYEAHARREVAEEAHVEITDPKYVCSMPVDDWRYRREQDGIVTILFEAKHMFGKPTPDDDICELRWFKTEDLTEENVVRGHWPLFQRLMEVKLQRCNDAKEE